MVLHNTDGTLRIEKRGDTVNISVFNPPATEADITLSHKEFLDVMEHLRAILVDTQFLEMVSQQQWEQLPQAHRDVCDSKNLKREDFTCNGCAGLVWNKPCEHAWDMYNTYGDCLLEK